MPILESEMPLEAMKRRTQTHKCGVCKGELVVCWGGAYGYDQYVLRCGENFDHDTMTDFKQQSKEYEEGNKLFRRLQGMDTTALMKMSEDTMLARIAQAKFPADLTPADKKLMAEVSISYGLDPLMQELMIYQGHPYPTINARYRKAQETGKFDGINTRPATAEERKARHCEEFDVLYCAEVWVKGSSHPFVGWGRVRGAERKGDSHLPIVKDPDRQAEKRAEAMGLRKGFSMPIPFQSWEEFEEQRAKEFIELEDVGKVNAKTGEIIEGEIIKESQEPTHWCWEHNCAFEIKQSRFGAFYAHKKPDGKWCNEKKRQAEASKTEVVEQPKSEEPSQDSRADQWYAEESEPQPEPELEPEPEFETESPPSVGFIDLDWLKESLKTLQARQLDAWSDSNMLSYLKVTYKVEALTVLEGAAKLDIGQAAHFSKGIQDALDKDKAKLI